MRRLLNRRLFGAGLLASAGVLCVQTMRTSGHISDRRKPKSRVAILHAGSYARSLEEKIKDGLRLITLELRGKTVLLKPNLVKYIPGAEVNTNHGFVARFVGERRTVLRCSVRRCSALVVFAANRLWLQNAGLAASGACHLVQASVDIVSITVVMPG